MNLCVIVIIVNLAVKEYGSLAKKKEIMQDACKNFGGKSVDC